MLESEFNLDYNDINSINKNFKPAKYIKIQRLELTKKMLLNGEFNFCNIKQELATLKHIFLKISINL